MGHDLPQALSETSNVPDAAELESERRWDDLFARSLDMLFEMAAEAIREDEAGLTEPLNPETFGNECRRSRLE